MFLVRVIVLRSKLFFFFFFHVIIIDAFLSRHFSFIRIFAFVMRLYILIENTSPNDFHVRFFQIIKEKRRRKGKKKKKMRSVSMQLVENEM